MSQFQTALLSKTLIWFPLNRNHWFLVFYQCVPLPLVNPLYIPLSPLYSCPLTVPRFKRINLDCDNWAQAKVDWLCFMNLLSSSQSLVPPPSLLLLLHWHLPRPFLAVIITAEISSLSFSVLYYIRFEQFNAKAATVWHCEIAYSAGLWVVQDIQDKSWVAAIYLSSLTVKE